MCLWRAKIWYVNVQGKYVKKVVLTKPLMLEGESCGDYNTPNLLQRILSLFKNVRPGADLTHFQVSSY